MTVYTPAKSRVFILESVQAVRAGGDDPFGGDFIQDFDVGGCQLIEQELVAGAAGGVAGALLVLTQHGKAHSRQA